MHQKEVFLETEKNRYKGLLVFATGICYFQFRGDRTHFVFLLPEFFFLEWDWGKEICGI